MDVLKIFIFEIINVWTNFVISFIWNKACSYIKAWNVERILFYLTYVDLFP